jgi:NitT/TauT family transport system permease protein
MDRTGNYEKLYLLKILEEITMSKTTLQKSIRSYGLKVFAICFWLVVWELASRWTDNELLLASPVTVLGTLLTMVGTVAFWQTILFSTLRILTGFMLAFLSGTILAVLAYHLRLVEELVSPLMKLTTAMPVASFIILALVWIRSRNLSVLISFMMGLPMIYSNVLQGLHAADEKLLQMAQVFRLSLWKKAVAIYIPSIKPFLRTAVIVGLGFCWKAGIAAEVIGIPTGSIGAQLYEAKLYLMTKELLAWTIVIIILSIIFENTFLILLRPRRRS